MIDSISHTNILWSLWQALSNGSFSPCGSQLQGPGSLAEIQPYLSPRRSQTQLNNYPGKHCRGVLRTCLGCLLLYLPCQTGAYEGSAHTDRAGYSQRIDRAGRRPDWTVYACFGPGRPGSQYNRLTGTAESRPGHDQCSHRRSTGTCSATTWPSFIGNHVDDHGIWTPLAISQPVRSPSTAELFTSRGACTPTGPACYETNTGVQT